MEGDQRRQQIAEVVHYLNESIFYVTKSVPTNAHLAQRTDRPDLVHRSGEIRLDYDLIDAVGIQVDLQHRIFSQDARIGCRKGVESQGERPVRLLVRTEVKRRAQGISSRQ